MRVGGFRLHIFSVVAHPCPCSHIASSTSSHAHIAHDSEKQPHELQQHAAFVIFQNIVSCVTQSRKADLCATTVMVLSEISAVLTFWAHCVEFLHKFSIIRDLAKRRDTSFCCWLSISRVSCSNMARWISLKWCLKWARPQSVKKARPAAYLESWVNHELMRLEHYGICHALAKLLM
jgi:hypothetical protein